MSFDYRKCLTLYFRISSFAIIVATNNEWCFDFRTVVHLPMTESDYFEIGHSFGIKKVKD